MSSTRKRKHEDEEDEVADAHVPWTAKEREMLVQLLVKVPTAAHLLENNALSDEDDGDPDEPLPQLDDANLGAAVHMLLGEFYSVLGVPFVPRDLRNLIVAYASTPARPTIRSYYVNEMRTTAQCSRDCNYDPPTATGEYTGFVLTEDEARAWCLEKLAYETRLFPNDDFDDRAWCTLYRTALEQRYGALTTDRLLAGVLDRINRRQPAYTNECVMLGAIASSASIRELVVPQ
jgi:hypothetical protein